MENQNIKYKDVPLIKEIEKCNDNILYYGEGGIGKTTQMQLAFNYFSSKCTNTVPVFLDADKEIDFRKADPLMSAIAYKYLGSDIETDDIWKLFTNNSPSSAKNYTYIIFVDGINELTQNNKGYLIEKITHIISESKNTRFIISSRIKENLGLRFKNIAIKPLEKKNILKYLGENYGANDNSKNINDSLVEILQIPLYLSVFKNTYNSSDYKPNIYDESTVRKADILDSYIQKILHEKRKTNAADTALFEFIVKYFLPALAFEMVKENVHVISITEYRKLRDNTKYFETFCYDENALDIFEQNSRKAHNYIVENFALLESHNDVYTFPHQIWRDYFCAKHIINCLNVAYSDQIQNDLEVPVDNEIRGFVGQLIYTYDEKLHYSKEEHFPPEKSCRMCECDFEAKDNLEEWDESPIEHYMQQHNLKQEEQNQISPLVTRNLIEIMKDSRDNEITAKYDNLDFKYSNFYNCNISESSFEKSRLSRDTFIPDEIRPNSIIYLDNKMIFECGLGYKKDIFIFDIGTKKVYKKITDCTAYCVKNGRYLFYSKNNIIYEYDIVFNKQIALSLTGHTDIVMAIAVSSNYKLLVSSGMDCSIRIWDLQNNTHNCKLIKANFVSECVDFSPDDSKVVFNEKHIIHILDIESEAEICELETNHTDIITTLFFTDNGKSIISYDNDTLHSNNIKTKSQLYKVHTYIFSDRANVFSYNKKFFCTIKASEIQIIRTDNGNIMKTIKFNTNIISAIAFSFDDNYISIGTYDGKIYIWDIHEKSKLLKYQALNNERIESLLYIPCRKHIIISIEGGIWLLDTCRYKKWEQLYEYCNSEYSVKCTKNGIIISTCNKMYAFWNKTQNKFANKFNTLLSQNTLIPSFPVFSNNEKIMALPDKYGTIYFYDVFTGKQITSVYNYKKRILTDDKDVIAWSVDDLKIIIADNCEGFITIWDIFENKLIGTMRIKDTETSNYITPFMNNIERGLPLFVFTAMITALSCSPDGTSLISGSLDGTIVLWNIKELKKIQPPFKGHNGRINSFHFSSDGKKVISASCDRTIKIWDMPSGKQIGKSLVGHESNVKIAKFSQNGKFIFSAGTDNTIRIWDSKNGKQLFIILCENMVTSLDEIILNNEVCLVAGCDQKIIIIWNLVTKKQLTINQLLDANIEHCNFKNADFNRFNDESKFCQILYDNGAYVPEKYKPKEIPFFMNKINDDENKCFEY